MCGYFTKVFVYLCKWKSMCLFKKSLFPGDHKDYICFQDPVEHTQKVRKEPFYLQISDLFLCLFADDSGKGGVNLLSHSFFKIRIL